jgi:hypothetical protein
MSEVHRYSVVTMLSEAGGKINYTPHGPDVVLASEFDAALARIAALQLLLNTADQRNADALDLARRAYAVIDDGYPVKRELEVFIGAGRCDLSAHIAGSKS